MGTTNILDLNNRLTKVEKENVAQNSYTSLKNKPKINSVTLTGNKTLADIGAAAAADVGDKTQLNTVDKSSTVAAINELNSGLIGEIDAIGTGVIVYRQGAMRILNLQGAESSSTGVISELSSSDRPLVQVLNPCVYNDGTTKNGYIIIEATGEIKLLDVTTDTAVSGGHAFSTISYYIL